MTDANPHGELTGCVRCPTGRTFTREAVCSACRRAEKKQEAKEQREDGDR
jgi:hypothetical protein